MRARISQKLNVPREYDPQHQRKTAKGEIVDKQQYGSLKDAEWAAYQTSKMTKGKRFQAYVCSCGYYHIGEVITEES